MFLIQCKDGPSLRWYDLAMGCPACGSTRIRWRNGVGFEHQMICFACQLVWELDNEIHAVSERRERKRVELYEKDLKNAKEWNERQDWMRLSGAGMDAQI